MGRVFFISLRWVSRGDGKVELMGYNVVVTSHNNNSVEKLQCIVMLQLDYHLAP